MADEKVIKQPEAIKLPIEELRVLAELADSQTFIVLKRLARRYTDNLKSLSFTLREEDPHFAIRHTRYVEQAVGMSLLIKAIEEAKKQLNSLEEKE